MKRARLNLLIDAVIGVAFLVTAVTGVAFLLPPVWQQTLLVGLSFHAWHWLHDWSGVAAAAGVALHLALHWRWVLHTATRWLAEARGELPERRAAAGRAAAPGRAAPPAPATMQTTPNGPPARYPEPAPTRRARSQGRLTRRGLLVGAAGFGAALVGGVALARIAGAVGTDQSSSAGAATGQSDAGGTAGSSSSGTAGSSSGGTTGTPGTSTGSSSASSGSSSSGTSTPRVVVDSSSCVACGHCIEVCPKSVFDWNSAGRATAQAPESCILCRRCVQVCPAAAITLNA